MIITFNLIIIRYTNYNNTRVIMSRSYHISHDELEAGDGPLHITRYALLDVIIIIFHFYSAHFSISVISMALYTIYCPQSLGMPAHAPTLVVLPPIYTINTQGDYLQTFSGTLGGAPGWGGSTANIQ